MKASVICAVLAFAVSLSAGAQSSGCDSDTGSAYVYVRDRYTTVATDSGADGRDLLGIPLLSATEVGYVTDTTVCQQASAAYTAAEGDGITNRQVYVFRLGSRYLVVDKNIYAGEWLIGWLFESTFQPVARLAT